MRSGQIAAYLAISFAMNVVLHAQEQSPPQQPAAPSRVELPNTPSSERTVQNREKRGPVPTHRFFDRTNNILTGVNVAAQLADAITTQAGPVRRIRICDPATGVCGVIPSAERNPIARPFVEHGWPGQIAYEGIVFGTDQLLRYMFHRTGHHRIERLVPLVMAGASTASAISNANNHR